MFEQRRPASRPPAWKPPPNAGNIKRADLQRLRSGPDRDRTCDHQRFPVLVWVAATPVATHTALTLPGGFCGPRRCAISSVRPAVLGVVCRCRGWRGIVLVGADRRRDVFVRYCCLFAGEFRHFAPFGVRPTGSGASKAARERGEHMGSRASRGAGARGTGGAGWTGRSACRPGRVRVRCAAGVSREP